MRILETGHEVRILAVDDDLGHIELIRRNLARAGFTNEIIPVCSGEEAMDFIYMRGKSVKLRGAC